MNRFTIFTIILSVSVVTMLSDLLLRDYLQGQGMQTSVISADKNTSGSEEEISPVLAGTEEVIDDSETVISDDTTVEEPTTDTKPAEVVEKVDTPKEEVKAPVTNAPVFLTDAIIKAAGFTGTPEDKQFTGKLFQLLDLGNFAVEKIKTVSVEQNQVLAASMTEIIVADEIQALQLYLLLQNKTKPYIDLTLNETNAYGDRSFYVNHAKKPNEAFLVVKIRNRIYGFAYVKFYHPELKKLITLLMDAK